MYTEPIQTAARPVNAPEQSAAPHLDSRSLFAEGCNEVEIHHNGRVYRLRCTRLGKLILTA